MPLNILTSRNITEPLVVSKFINKFSKEGDYLQSNVRFGTSNNIDYFEHIRNKKLFNNLSHSIGLGGCSSSNVKVAEKNNSWFDCCNLKEKDVCFDGQYFRDLSKEQSIKDKYRESGWVYKHTENCILHFEKQLRIAPTKADIHVYFDTSSMSIHDARIARSSLVTWFDGVKARYPDYEGNLYIFALNDHSPLKDVGVITERWLRFPKYSYTGDDLVIPSGGWGALNILPPNYGTPLYEPPKDIIILSFIDETYTRKLNPGESSEYVFCYESGFCGYHGSVVNFGSGTGYGASNNPIQPTKAYKDDFDTMLTYRSMFTSFSFILYPIVKLAQSVNRACLLQMAAAVEGKVLTPTEVTALNASIDLSILTTQNPYTEPLKNYGFRGLWNKTSPASEVFSSTTFGDELTDMLGLDKYITQKTKEELPIKVFSEKVHGYNNRWDLYDKSFTKCKHINNNLEKLFKFAIK